MNPPSQAKSTPELDLTSRLKLYRHMLTSRLLDEKEEEFTQRGEAFFHVSGAGHESSAALADHLGPQDWLHAHYRDKALLLARGISVESFFLSLLCKDDSHSRGRQMSAHMSDPSLHVLSLVGPVGNNALQAVGVAEAVHDREGAPIVLCSMGDGTSQQGEVLEAIAHAVRESLPVLFLVEDNRFSISTLTPGKTFYSTPDGLASQFYGIPIEYMDGRRVTECHDSFGQLVRAMRRDRKPRIAVMNVERLTNHTNADDQKVYRTETEISAARTSGDPIAILREELIASGVEAARLDAERDEIRRSVAEIAERALYAPDPEPTHEAKAPLSGRLLMSDSENRGEAPNGNPLTMLHALRETLRHRLGADDRVMLLGEDIEDPKGDVFGVTRGLSTAYPGRVQNSPLAESSIVGLSIGRALAGRRPVAFLQFADFLPIAFNQIASELGSMYWRTDGGWTAPVIVMITCGGYRPGLGPFHAQSLEALAAHTPGIDIYMPSTAADAAGMLNAAFDSSRPTLFFYPKCLLNDREQVTSANVEVQFVPPGRARLLQSGSDITLVGWGSTVGLCSKAAAALDGAGFSADVIDLRSISPWDSAMVVDSAQRTRRLVVVHEDSHTCGFGAEVLATVAEQTDVPIRMRRVTRADTHVPCNFSNQLEVLPSFRRTLETAADLLDLDLTWEMPAKAAPGETIIEAIGSSPSDESVVVVEWLVAEGQTIAIGDEIATLEADKALLEFTAPAGGVVKQRVAEVGDRIRVGDPLLILTTGDAKTHTKPVTREEPGRPILTPRASAPSVSPAAFAVARATAGPITARLLTPSIVLGSRCQSNDDFDFAEYDSEAIERRTGIVRRTRVGEGQDALSMAVQAAREALKAQDLTIDQIDLLICSTGTPMMITPSMACMILGELAGDRKGVQMPAYDVNAACSGYLYALQSAWDTIQQNPEARVLVITTEVLSPLLNPSDFSTAIIFGDAATATVICGNPIGNDDGYAFHRPLLSATADTHQAIYVPSHTGACIHMDGQRVFSEAVRRMTDILRRACEREQIELTQLDLVVPHQANQRITESIRSRIGFPPEKMFSNIRDLGNTSSNSIPIALSEVMALEQRPLNIGLCAFGGGFTYGACIMRGGA